MWRLSNSLSNALQFINAGAMIAMGLQVIGCGMKLAERTKNAIQWTKEYINGWVFYDHVCYLATYKDGRYHVIYHMDAWPYFPWTVASTALPCRYLNDLPTFTHYMVRHYKNGVRHEELYVHGKKKEAAVDEVPFLYAMVNNHQDVLPHIIKWMPYCNELTVRDIVCLLQHYYSLPLYIHDSLDTSFITILHKDTLEEQVFKAEDKLLM